MAGRRANRRYCFTIFDADCVARGEKLFGDPVNEQVAFAVWQHERGHAEDHLHIQGYVRFKQPTTLGQLKHYLNCDGAHCEPANGNEQQNIEYCTKSDTRVAGPWQFGHTAKPGSRSDLSNAVELVKSGKSLADVATEYPTTFVRNYRGLGMLRSVLAQKPAIRNIETGVIVGPTGIGKSYTVFTRFPDIYRVLYPTSQSHVLWWPGYEGQDCILFDDFDSTQISIVNMLNLLDRYPLQIRTNGDSYVWAQWTRIVITTNVHPNIWYSAALPAHTAALMRRIDWIVEAETREELQQKLRPASPPASPIPNTLDG